MKKLALFVEGETEIEFCMLLLKNWIGNDKVTFDSHRIVGGTSIDRYEIRYEVPCESDTLEYSILIIGCGQDDKVNLEIKDQFKSLKREGYEMIIGLRDVYRGPQSKLSDVIDVEQYKMLGLVTDPALPIHIVVSVMEIEAWFLAEFSHFCRVNKNLTRDLILQNYEFDPHDGDVERRIHPTNDLRSIYKLVGAQYGKGYGANIALRKLDFVEVRKVSRRVTRLKRLLDTFQLFFRIPYLTDTN